MGRVEGKVAFITGAARGQGRSHAIRLAQEGADIIAVDLCESIESVTPFYAGATEADLAETVRAVEALDRRIVATKADVRDYAALKSALDDGVAQLGHVDIVSVNAGIFEFGNPAHEVSEQEWSDILSINLTGAWHTTKAVTPHLIQQGTGGSIILTSSTLGLKAAPFVVSYTTSKHAVVGSDAHPRVGARPAPRPGQHGAPLWRGNRHDHERGVVAVVHARHRAPDDEQGAAAYQATNALEVPWSRAT